MRGHLLAGLTVEVTDTDAEGRFVVGDGCSYLLRVACFALKTVETSSFKLESVRTSHRQRLMRSRYLAREKRCGVLIDAATLTGTTGFTARHHGGVMSNDAELEQVRKTPLFSTFPMFVPRETSKRSFSQGRLGTDEQKKCCP